MALGTERVFLLTLQFLSPPPLEAPRCSPLYTLEVSVVTGQTWDQSLPLPSAGLEPVS